MIAVTAGLIVLSLIACTRAATRTMGSSQGPPLVPPAPSAASASAGSSQLTVVWVGGTLSDVTPDVLKIHEASGSTVTLQRLAEGATAFFRVSGSRWLQLDRSAQVPAGQAACVEAGMAGSSFLALRVFLGVACGPS